MWAIDVGANIGAFTLIMARQVGETGRVLAIEPYPFVAERLVENLSLNRMLNVQVVMCALADRSKTATLYVPDPKWPNQGVASLSPVRGSQLVSQIEVQCFTLDDLLEKLDWTERLDLMKIDVEGHEMSVLRGG